MLHSSRFPFTESVYYITTTFDNTVGYIRQILIFRRHFTLQMQQEGENMILKFNDATEIQVQQVTEIGGRLQVLVANTTPEYLRVLFTDPLKTQHMRAEEREQLVGEYEGYTEFFRTEEYTGKLYGVVVNQVGKSTEERLASIQQGQDELKEAQEQDTKQITDLQMAICELYEMGVGV